jgi:hypothetical protein
MRNNFFSFPGLILSLVLLLQSYALKSQVIFNENFEGDFPSTNWQIITEAGPLGWWAVYDPFYSYNGIGAMISEKANFVSQVNTWAFTKNIALTPGVNYRLSYWYSQMAGSNKLKVTIGTGASIAAQNTVIHDYPVIPNHQYVEAVDNFTVPSSGNYNIGFNSFSDAESGVLLIDSIVLIASPVCTGSPVAGAVSGPVSACQGVPFNLNLSGAYAVAGLSLQWQYSVAGANNFINIAGANSTTLNTTQTIASDYRCIVTCISNGSTAVSNIFTVAATICYCAPAGTCNNANQLTNVHFGSIDNTTTCNNNGYSDYSTTLPVASVNAGKSVPISLAITSKGLNYAAAWIDYNQNGIFESNEYYNLGYVDNGNLAVTTKQLSGSMLIPLPTMAGNTRLRVRFSSQIPITAADACLANVAGETEDYKINISFLPVCSGTPSGGTISASVIDIAPDSLFTLKLSNSSTELSTGFSFQWQSSPDSSNWINLPGANELSLQTSQHSATYYRCKTTCNSGTFAYSTIVLISMKPFYQQYCSLPPSSCSVFPFSGIDSVSIGTLHNSSTCSANGYSDYTASVPASDIQAGSYAKIFLKFNSNDATVKKYGVIGIDFDHSGQFEEEEIIYLGDGTSSLKTNIRIPFNALTGITRMRIRLSPYTHPGMCLTGEFGETEDYLVNIISSSRAGSKFSFYVNPLATGNGDGLSWANAFIRLDTAISVAFPADTIRVANGIYNPIVSPPYFFTPKDSTVLLGGYSNTGNPTDTDRNWATNQTILDGTGVNYLVFGSNHLIMDGFVLQGIFSRTKNMCVFTIIDKVGVSIKHCVFRDNYTSEGNSLAVGIANSSVTIGDCFFTNNINVNTAYFQSASIVSIAKNSKVDFYNSIFYKNKSYMGMLEVNQSQLSFTNCDFVSNHTTAERTLTVINNSTLNVNNSIFFNNNNNYDLSIDSSEITVSNSAVSFANTITQAYNYGNAALLSKNPKFKDSSSLAGPDNLFYTLDDGLQLINPCSPAMNTGINTAVVGITKDILNKNRIVASTIDLGAYEVQTDPLSIPTTLYVNKLANGDGSGTSWINAFKDLQTAMEYCSDTVRVASGTYFPSGSDVLKSIWLENKRVLLGGYPNTGSPSDLQRNPGIYPTLLSGEMPNANGEKSQIVIRARTVDSTAIVDGFTITKALTLNYNNSGAIYLTIHSNPVFRNCTISNNRNRMGAGLHTKDSSSPRFENSIFENNSLVSIGFGGAVANENSNPVFNKCIFRYNRTDISTSSASGGGAVYNFNSNPVFDSCTFLRNVANNWGGAFTNTNSNPVIRNSSFLGNMVSPYGGFGGNACDINNDHSSPEIFNTIFYDSSGCNFGGSIYNENQSNPSFTKCEFKNGYADLDGGFIFNDNSSPVLVSCIFTGARCHYGAGGVIGNRNYSAPIVINCIASGNTANQGSFMSNSRSFPVVKNTVIVKSGRMSAFGPLADLDNSPVFFNTDSSRLTISNSIIWGNIILPGKDISDPTGTTTPSLVNNSITQSFGTTGENNNLVGFNPLFIDITNPAGNDGIFYTSDDGLNLSACSPAINTGSNSSILGYNTDIVNNPRIYNSIVDMGAYEIQHTPGLVTNFWTGSVNNNWENPLNWSLGTVPNPCADVIINSGIIILNSDIVIHSLSVMQGANLSIAAGHHLFITH